MPSVKLQDLLAAGVHFGHQTQRWNPKMKRFIFGQRNRIHIINLKRTQQCLEAALETVANVVGGGKSVLFVGTKMQAKDIIVQEATRCNQFFVTERWLGGMLTNFRTIKMSISRLKALDDGFNSGEFAKRTKKEQVRLKKERDRLEKTFCGIKDMPSLPGAIFVVDTRRERIAVAEANRLGVPVIGIVDTNSDPDLIDLPIPGNDDALRSIQLFARAISDTVLESSPKTGAGASDKPPAASPVPAAAEANEPSVSG